MTQHACKNMRLTSEKSRIKTAANGAINTIRGLTRSQLQLDRRAVMQPIEKCSWPQCPKLAKVRGMCNNHYNRWQEGPDFVRAFPVFATERERFDSKFTKLGVDDCWEWEAGLGRDGYGQFENQADPKSKSAHRYALIMAVGPAPFPRADACHSCDNPPCVNPAHLRWGTRQENANDSRDHGTRPLGEDRVQAILTADAVRAIRVRSEQGEPGSVIARSYGVHRNTVYSILSGHRWAHVA